MRFLLSSSTALFVLSAALPAFAADPIKLQLGGFSKWWVVGVWNNNAFQKAANASYNNVDVKGDNEVYFLGKTTLDNGLTVGVRVELEAGGHTDMTTDPIDAAFLYLESGYGKIVLGSDRSVAYNLGLSAPDAASNWNDGGIATGGFSLVIPSQMFSINPHTKDYNTTMITGDDKAEKISYITPQLYGFTAGATYSPNGAEDVRGPVNLNEPVASFQGNRQKAFQESYALALNYTGTFSDVGVKAYGAWQNSALNGRYFGNCCSDKINMYAAGTQLSYAGFTLGGSMRWNDHKVADTAYTPVAGGRRSQSGHAWDAGLMYGQGPWAVSIAYYQSSVKNRLDIAAKDVIQFYQASAKYDLGPGVAVQGSAGYGKLNGEARTDATVNKGWYAMTGVALTF